MGTLYRNLYRLVVLTAILSLSSALAESSEGVSISSPVELEQRIGDRLNRVEEFRFIEQEATRLGVRAWLFGGTAAGYAHYVKWDLQREKGDHRFQADRFDYDYTNIYRSTQDLDIVIDGDEHQASSLQRALQEKYPHLQGSKTAWEVRLLTQDMGDKLAILNNPDFMNQHTDSNSTGMIEITKPKPGESAVRDVRDWNSKEPYFLKDVREGKLHYYFSPLHHSTKFAKEGRNPPILSAIRYLTKAFQYELELRPEDLAKIKAVVDEFNPNRAIKSKYVSDWIEKNGKKLFQNAVNLEYAWNTLEQLGLRQKLKAIKNDANTIDSLAWWMNKEPLRTGELGKGSGKTARELGLDIVAHETISFPAYDSITRAHSGEPNVFISRATAEGEVAAYGDGFYVRVGRKGARGTGITIRFHLDPNAREGTDFDRVRMAGYLVVKNKAALQVIPESLNLTPVEYFRWIATSNKMDDSDRAIFDKQRRRISNKVLTPSEEEEILELVKNAIDAILEKTRSIGKLRGLPVLQEWFLMPASAKHPELLAALLKKQSPSIDFFIAREFLSKSHWANHPEFIDALLKNKNDSFVHYALIAGALSRPHWQAHPQWVEWMDALMKRKSSSYFDKEVVMNILPQSIATNHPEWMEMIIRRVDLSTEFVTLGRLQEVLSEPQWRDHPALRRLVNGEVPTLENLKKAFSKGRSLILQPKHDGVGTCVPQQLAIRLAALAESSGFHKNQLRTYGQRAALGGVASALPLYIASEGTSAYLQRKAIAKIEKGNPEEVAAAFETLKTVRLLYAEDVLDKLGKIASSRDQLTAMRSIEVFSNASSTTESATLGLIQILSTPNPNVTPDDRRRIRIAALEALKTRKLYHESVIKKLENLILNEKDPSFAPSLLEVINQCDPQQALRLRTILINSSDEEVRKAAVQALQKMK
jgi:hypothetical protein